MPAVASTSALFVLIAALVCGCTRAQREVDANDIDPAALPDQESWGAVLRIDEDGRPRLALEAPYLARYERPPDSVFTALGPDGTADTTRVRVQLFDAAGVLAATVRSDRLLYYDEDRRFVAEGRAVVQTTGGRRLESEQVAWDEETRRLRAAGAFRFTSPSERIRGVGLDAAEDLSQYTFRRASGELEVEE